MKLPTLERKFSVTEIGNKMAPLNKTDLPENPFRKEIRRLSTVSEPILSLQTKKRPSTDFSTEVLMKHVRMQKRNSLHTVGTTRSWRSVGARVANIIRVKNVMTRFREQAKPQMDTISDEVFEIKEMPKEPRFASTLSPEAQYATMKGYEDVVYQNLCQLYPENLLKMRRNKTPLPGVMISISNENSTPEAQNMKYIDMSKKGPQGTSVTKFESLELSSSTATPNVQPIKLLSPRNADENLQSSAQLSPRITDDNVQRSKVLFPRKTDENSLTQPENAQAKNLDLLTPSKEKQLVLTYRYQRAMDLLDVLRRSQGSYTLSPRKSLDEKVEPLQEYNNWAYVWTHHFEKKNAQSAHKLDIHCKTSA